jgi:hypothetical protein
LAESRHAPRVLPPTATPLTLAAETLRAADSAAASVAPAKEEDRIPLFWRVFGGTLLSITALVCITVYQQLTNNLSGLRNDFSHLSDDLRKDLGRLNEAQSGLLKKDEFNLRMRSVWDSLKEVRVDAGGVTALRERAALLEQQMKRGEEERKELLGEVLRLRAAEAGNDERRELHRELQRLRERLAAVEGCPAMLPAGPEPK